ncbi:MAG: HPr family phosphocarrier protein [Anaeroplasmataceae bacterium]
MKRKYKIISETGIHARPATLLVNEAVKYESEIDIIFNGKKINLKSIMGIMSLGIYNGEHITISCCGIDEQKASEELNRIMVELKLGKEII